MTQAYVTNYEWTFDPDRSDGGILVDHINSDMPEYKPGKSYSLELVFWQNTQDSAAIEEESGGTLGGAAGFTLGGATGASVGSLQGKGSNVARYEKVREYTRWAGRYSLTKAIDGTPRLSEHTPTDASVDSIIVKLESGSAYTATPDLWVAVDDVDDTTRFVNDMARLSIRVTVLARGDQYASRSSLKDALGSDLV